MKILIAEDEKAMSDALAAVLKHFGYEVDASMTGSPLRKRRGRTPTVV